MHVPSRLAPPNVDCSTYFSSNSRSYSAKLRSFSSASRLWPHPPRKFPVGIWTSQRLNRAAITTPPTLNRDSASTCESSTSWTARWHFSLWTYELWQMKTFEWRRSPKMSCNFLASELLFRKRFRRKSNGTQFHVTVIDTLKQTVPNNVKSVTLR